MGARGRLGKAAVCAAILCAAARAAASTVVEPIARLSLEGGYDSNVLHDGASPDRMGRVSPEAGFRLRDHLSTITLAWRGDWVTYQRLVPGGTWSHRGDLVVDARPTRRLDVDVALRASRAVDPLGLALAGVFRPGRQSALVLGGSARAEYRWTRRLNLAATYSERTVRFADGTGGALHRPGAEALWRATPRLAVGGTYRVGVFQGFDPRGDDLAYSHALEARARWRATRRLAIEATAGPAVWIGGDSSGTSLVPEAAVALLGSSRWWAVRAGASHGLGIGSTAAPALVDALELGAERRFGRRFVVRGDGGLWHSGAPPRGRDSVTGWAASAEAGMLVGMNVRLALGAAHFARLDDGAPELRRTTVGLRLGWELPAR